MKTFQQRAGRLASMITGGRHRRIDKRARRRGASPARPRWRPFEPLEARVLLSTVTGTVWFDVNFNGSMQAGESGVGGFTVFHDANANGQLGAGENSAVTDINGDYSLTGLPNNQTLRIAQIVPDGWVQTAPGAPSFTRFATPGSGTQSNVDFGVVRTATVTGTVYRDSDADGTRDAGEGGLNGWTMQLVNPDNSQVVATTTTNFQGEFEFEDVLPREYLVREVVQSGWIQTTPGEPNLSHMVTLISGQVLEAGGFEFGNVQEASVSGTVWSDEDADGTRDAGEPGLSGWEVYADLNNNGQWDDVSADAAIRTYTGSSIAIPDNNRNDPITPQINVTGVPGFITDLNVTVNIDHTFTADVEVHLVSPSGTRVELFKDIGSEFDNFRNTTLDDEASVSIENGTAPFTGSFRPQGELSDFFGQKPNGVWTLEVVDDFPIDTGTFNDFTLEFTVEIPAEPRTTTNSSGAYTVDGLLPGSTTIRQTVEAGFTPTFPGTGRHVVSLSEGQNVTNRNFGNSGGSGGSGASLDIDDNGAGDAFTDGILAIRHLIGFTGSTLVNGAIGSGAQRTSASAIQTYLQDNAEMLDVDGNGTGDAFTDGILIVRYLIGFTGSTLVDGAIGSGATRTSASAITAYLDQFSPTAGAAAAPMSLTASSDDLTTSSASDDDGARDALAAAWYGDKTRLRLVEQDASLDDGFSLDDDSEEPVWAEWQS